MAKSRAALPRRLLDRDEDGLKEQLFPGKGRGVVTMRPFAKGDFVLEYRGDLIRRAEASRRSRAYEAEDKGCYILDFRFSERALSIDATAESGFLGRLVNHSRGRDNLKLQLFVVRGEPRVGLVARRDIAAGEELSFDYGERRPDVLRELPWLRADTSNAVSPALVTPPVPKHYPPVIWHLIYLAKAYRKEKEAQKKDGLSQNQ